MNKLITLFLILILGLNGFSQSTFVKGYFIKNSDEKINCLIKNNDWLNNPTEFEYKITESAEQKTLTISSVKEFGFFNISKYVRHNVDIDRSSKIVNELGYNKNPFFNKEELFLKVLIAGKANLFLYEDKGLTRYFYNKDNSEVAQLVYKNYLTSEGQVAKNNEFRRQLWNTLKCESISMNNLSKLDYKQSALIKFFIKYNECTNSEFINYIKKKEKKDLFNLTLRPGVSSSSLVLKNGEYNWKEIDFGKGLTSFRFGVEAEFVLGFNNNKWAILFEPTYQQFESEETFVSNRTTEEESVANVNHKSIQINLGLRHYLFLNKNLKLFVNALGVIDNKVNSTVEVNRVGGAELFSAKLVTGISTALGIGCKYNDRYNLELRYLPNRNILNSQGSWGTEFKSVSIILGYSIF
ncbi:tRNA modification GTPase [Algibacter amylolyticus]|uniref:tRNA modification GTPase n=1 Tax=Algibacter amylolyticus TaxID=1608400 RepID=A0A5M7B5P9_9FLAO|nr:tRNA modification GTPase [Algibacter amylolyticus]KAA5824853.1 tRNA modification GTPase [Algibacter amylolyticus]MBB5268979.1 hypothetical protein [Algibacter amylolyticus]TSJ76018.1 tRNA modification GTPase [Algibacter amylolyticus]